MRYIGLTGRSGTGKSIVASCARKMKIPTVDCDRLYRSMTDRPSPLQEAVVRSFGPESVAGGMLNRPYLRKAVFNDPLALNELNCLTGLYIGEFLDDLAESMRGCSMVLLDAPTLYQTGIDRKCERVICLLSSDEDCVKRIVSRDGISESDARIRLQNQLPDAFYLEKTKDIIMNSGTEAELRQKANALLKSMLPKPSHAK
ncbi:MAG: dephospho-CoA kinase [Clostridia bacterium]|nr:dephospho-CoA kinase [Clostridia bacterium]